MKLMSEMNAAGASEISDAEAARMIEDFLASGAQTRGIAEDSVASGAAAGSIVAQDPLKSMLSELGGSIEGQTQGMIASEAGIAGNPGGRIAGKAGQSLGLNAVSAAGGSQSNLSGAEFLGTLNSIREASQARSSGSGGEGAEGFGSSGQRPNLQVIEGGLRQRDEALDGPNSRKNPFSTEWSGIEGAGAAVAHPAGMSLHGGPHPLQLEGQVTQGSMARERLSSEALLGLSTGIRNFSSANPQGAGEILVRLKPDNLGELRLRVSANGSDIGLKIQASDERSRKILEESMGYLKESLASQNLSLGKVEIALAQGDGSSGAGNRQDPNPGQQGDSRLMGNWSGQDASQGGRGQSGSTNWDGGDADSRGGSMRTGRPAMTASTAAHVAGVGFRGGSNLFAGGSGKIDVTV